MNLKREQKVGALRIHGNGAGTSKHEHMLVARVFVTPRNCVFIS